ETLGCGASSDDASTHVTGVPCGNRRAPAGNGYRNANRVCYRIKRQQTLIKEKPRIRYGAFVTTCRAGLFAVRLAQPFIDQWFLLIHEVANGRLVVSLLRDIHIVL